MTAQSFMSLVITVVMVTALSPSNSFAISSNCAKQIHKQAVSTAIELSPVELKNILKKYEVTMHREIHAVHSSTSSSMATYRDVALSIAKEKDSARYETMARFLAASTMEMYAGNCPIKMHDSCNEDEILKQVTVKFDGYNPNIDYSKYQDSNAILQEYKSLKPREQMLHFYNKLANDILDLWTNIWEKAGRDVAGLPEKDTVFYGKDNKIIVQQEKRSQKATAKVNQVIQNQNSNITSDNDENISAFANGSLLKDESSYLLKMKSGNEMTWSHVNDEGGNYCTYKGGGLFCVDKRDVASVKEQKEKQDPNATVIYSSDGQSSQSRNPNWDASNYDPKSGVGKIVSVNECIARESSDVGIKACKDAEDKRMKYGSGSQGYKDYMRERGR